MSASAAGPASLDVVGVGDASVDCFVAVDRLPRAGEKVSGTHLGVHPGGVVANVVAGVARLGLRAGLVARLGTDVFGDLAAADLARRGVDLSAVVRLPDTDTYLCLVHLDPHGEKALTIARTDAMFPSPDEVDDSLLARTRHVHLAPFDLGAAVQVARRARAHGASVSVDLEPTSMGTDRATLDALVAETDVLLPNSFAVEAWLGESASERTAAELLRRGPRLVAIGRGAAGAIVGDRAGQHRVPAREVEVRDTTGAGDAFNAVVIAGWLEQRDARQIGRRATAAAARVITMVGGRSGQPTAEQLEQLLAAGATS